MNPQVSHLSLYDIAGTKGVAADVSHINSRAIAQVSARCSALARLQGLCSSLQPPPGSPAGL